MARIKYGNGVADIRGAINGTVFSRNASGAYARNKTAPTNANTPSQVTARSRFQGLTTGWRGLTEEQRQSFNEAAPSFPQTNVLGETVILTGQQLYMKLNGNLVATGAAPITSAPAPVVMPGATGVIDSLTSGVMDLTMSQELPADFQYVVEASAPVSAGVTKSNSTRFKAIGAFGVDSGISLNGEYTSIYGARAVGQKVFFRVYIVSARGQKVKCAELTGIVAAS